MNNAATNIGIQVSVSVPAFHSLDIFAKVKLLNFTVFLFNFLKSFTHGLYHLRVSRAMHKDSNFSISSPALIFHISFDNS